MDSHLSELKKEKDFLINLLERKAKEFKFHSYKYHSEEEYYNYAKTKKILNLLKHLLNDKR